MDLIDYAKKLYHYLQNEKGYIVLKKESRYFTNFYAYPANDPKYFKDGRLINFDHKTFYGEKDFFSQVNKRPQTISFEKDDLMLFDSFIELYNRESKQEKIDYLKNIDKWTHHTWKDHIFKIIEGISYNKKEVIDNIQSFPVSVLEASTVNLNALDEFLISKELTDKELDSFYLKFFKNRKNQLKSSKIGPIYSNFLIKKYGRDEEKLKTYFDFFNFIKDEFVEVNLDFNEPISKNIISTRINCRKASQLICIPNFDESKIKDEIKNFILAFKDIKQINQSIFEEYDKQKCIVEIRLYSDTSITQEELNQYIKKFLFFKKKNPDIKTNRSNVEKFLMQDELDLILPNKETEEVKQRKIKI